MASRVQLKSLRWISATAVLAIVAALQLVSTSVRMGQGALHQADAGRKLLLESKGGIEPGHYPLYQKQEHQLSTEEAESEMQVTSVLSSEKERTVQARSFEPWPADLPLPCFPPDGIMVDNGSLIVPHDHPVSQGFFFLKTYKTGSSTSAGVNLRIARNLAHRQRREFVFCNSRFDHALRWKSHGADLFGNRTIGESFLWGLLRDPTKRAVSQFFHFKVSRSGWEPTMANFQKTLRRDKHNYYVRSLSLRPFVDDRDDGFEFANQIMEDYDFIGVTERIDESFVALAMLLRIPLSDVLYLSAKLNGGYDDHCSFIQPSSLTTEMKEYIQSDEWKGIVKEDWALYMAANHSLDMTIVRLGRDRFEKNLVLYKAALSEGNRRCREKTVFPCTKDGRHVPPPETDCLWSDAGCGAKCLDEVATDLQLDEQFWNPPSLLKGPKFRDTKERRLRYPYPP